VAESESRERDARAEAEKARAEAASAQALVTEGRSREAAGAEERELLVRRLEEVEGLISSSELVERHLEVVCDCFLVR
jgi:hypothetical protein